MALSLGKQVSVLENSKFLGGSLILAGHRSQPHHASVCSPGEEQTLNWQGCSRDDFKVTMLLHLVMRLTKLISKCRDCPLKSSRSGNTSFSFIAADRTDT